MNTDTVMVGVNLMFIGMSTVFIFLLIMIFAMNISHKAIEFINKFFPEEYINVDINKNKKNNTNVDEIAIAIASSYNKIKKENKNE